MSTYLVEFVGGPFDGYKQQVSTKSGSFAAEVALPVSRNVFTLLEGQPPAKSEPLTSIAFYRQDLSGSGARYRFVASVSPVGIHATE